MKHVYYQYRFLTFYACVPRVSAKLLKWQIQCCHFNKYFISYTSTGIMNLLH